jgi:hypothetical protein
LRVNAAGEGAAPHSQAGRWIVTTRHATEDEDDLNAGELGVCNALPRNVLARAKTRRHR